MHRAILFSLCLASCAALNAQAPAQPPAAVTAAPAAANPVIAEMKRFYTQYKGYWTRVAAVMPEADYGFKPTPDIRSFAELLAHVADHQTGFCSSVRGPRKQGDAATKKTKADLIAALAASYTECDAAWDSITDANYAESAGQRSKLGTLIVDVAHSEEEYGYVSVYLRLKGITPPSSDRSGGR